MLNAVNNSPNIHWFCNECNDGNRGVAASIDRMNEAIGALSSSLSSDLLKFVNSFKAMMDTFIGAVSTLNMMQHPIAVNSSPKVDSHANQNASSVKVVDETSLSTESAIGPSGNIHCSIVSNVSDDMSLRSVVVSNVGKDITTEFLADYFDKELQIDKKFIKVALLLPSGISAENLTYYQYKVSVPVSHYNSVMCPDSWPKGVIVRDFVHKRKTNCGVQMNHFLPKKISAL